MSEESEYSKIFEFASWSTLRWQELAKGKADKTYSAVRVRETPYGMAMSVVVNKRRAMVVEAHRDMWGTWLTFRLGNKAFTIAQEDGTLSAIDALIQGLQELKSLTMTPEDMLEMQKEAAEDAADQSGLAGPV